MCTRLVTSRMDTETLRVSHTLFSSFSLGVWYEVLVTRKANCYCMLWIRCWCWALTNYPWVHLKMVL